MRAQTAKSKGQRAKAENIFHMRFDNCHLSLKSKKISIWEPVE